MSSLLTLIVILQALCVWRIWKIERSEGNTNTLRRRSPRPRASVIAT